MCYGRVPPDDRYGRIVLYGWFCCMVCDVCDTVCAATDFVGMGGFYVLQDIVSTVQ